MNCVLKLANLVGSVNNERIEGNILMGKIKLIRRELGKIEIANLNQLGKVYLNLRGFENLKCWVQKKEPIAEFLFDEKSMHS